MDFMHLLKTGLVLVFLFSGGDTFKSLSQSIIKLADQSCSSAFILESRDSSDFKFLNGLLYTLAETHAGFLLMEKERVGQKQADRMRRSCPCFDIFNFWGSKNFTLDVSPFEASYSRQIYVMPPTPNQMMILAEAKNTSQLQQPVAILSESSRKADSEDADMWLWCPPKKRKTGVYGYTKQMDHFCTNKQKWVSKAHEMRKVYRLCNDSPEKGYYQGREMGFTGILGFTIDTLARIVSKALGSTKLKMKYSRGCLELTKNIPKKRNTLGQIYHDLVDFGSFVSSTPSINKKFDYMLFAYDDHFFLGQHPKLLSQHENLSYPFDRVTWMFSLLSVVSMTFCFFWFNKTKREGPMLNILFLSLGVMFMENHYKEYKTKLSRAMLLRYLWLFCALILSLAYQGTLKASLAKKNYEKPIETHDQMMDLDLPVYSFIRLSQLSHNLPTHKRLHTYIVNKNTTISIPQTFSFLNKLFKGKRAFIHSTSTYQLTFQKYFISKYGRRKVFPLVKLKEKLLFFHMTFVVKKYLAQTEEIKKVVDHLNDAGISEYVFTKKEDPFSHIKQASDQETNMSLNFDHILIVNCFFAASLIVSLMVLLCEMPNVRSTYYGRRSTLRPYSGGNIRPFSSILRPFSGTLYVNPVNYSYQ